MWADAAETVPLRSLHLSHWDVAAETALSISTTHTSITELELAVRRIPMPSLKCVKSRQVFCCVDFSSLSLPLVVSAGLHGCD